MFEALIALGAGFILLATIFLPWINRSAIKELRGQVETLRQQVDFLLKDVRGHLLEIERKSISPSVAEKSAAKPDYTKPVDIEPEQPKAKEESQPSVGAEERAAAFNRYQEKVSQTQPSRAQPTQRTAQPKKEAISFERQFGARLPVWIGGIALAFAGFYMVKYSIEVGLLSPAVRTVLGLIFGGCLLGAGEFVRKRPSIANGTKIAQALTGAGIVDLYVCIFAATNLYDLIPPMLGFVGMAAVTAGAVLLSLLHGMPIAIFGLVGGFITPALISTGNPQAISLFTYLVLIMGWLLFVIRMRSWWFLALPVVLASFAWVSVWIFGGYFSPKDSLPLALFLIALCFFVTRSSAAQFEKDLESPSGDAVATPLLNYMALGGSALLMGIVGIQAGFGVMEWSLFGLLSAGCIALAAFNQKLYGIVPLGTLAINVLFLAVWFPTDHPFFATILVCFAALYGVSGYIFQTRSEKPHLWSILLASSTLAFFLLGYFHLKNSDIIPGIPMFWGLLSLAFSALFTALLAKVKSGFSKDFPYREHILATYALASSAFMSVALSIEVANDYLPVAFAGQLFATSWISTGFDLKALRPIAFGLTGIFAGLSLPLLYPVVELALASLTGGTPHSHSLQFTNMPFVRLALSAVFFAGASYFQRREKDGNFVRILEGGAVVLISLACYYGLRALFHTGENFVSIRAGFVERGIITNLSYLFGGFCLWFGSKFSRRSIVHSGAALCLIGLFRTAYFDLFIINPLLTKQSVGSWPIFNALWLNYALPIVWIGAGRAYLAEILNVVWKKRAQIAMLVLAFSFVTLQVRQYFQGDILSHGSLTNAEIYSYSVVWLLFGLGLLFFGTIKKDKVVRIASLAVMILTVAKAFLYDASELEGLLRVFSFMGLGISLLGLSWFYTRFVFVGEEEAIER